METFFAFLGVISLIFILSVVLVSLDNKHHAKIKLIDATFAPNTTLYTKNPPNDIIFHFYNSSKKDIRGFDMIIEVTDDMRRSIDIISIDFYRYDKPFKRGSHMDLRYNGSNKIEPVRAEMRKLYYKTRIGRLLYSDGTLSTQFAYGP